MGRENETDQEVYVIDLGGMLGVDAVFPQKFTIYIPDKDRDGNAVPNIDGWIRLAMRLLNHVNGGVSAHAGVSGMWFNKDTGKTVIENTTLVYSFVDPEKFLRKFGVIRKFLQRFGKETNQGEVVVEFNGAFYKISKYVDSVDK